MKKFEQLYKETAHNYTKERYKALGYSIMEDLYDDYLKEQPSLHIIPKIIHQVWVGDKPIPEEFKVYMQTWIDFHPDWTYVLWTDDNIGNIKSINKDIYNKMTNVGAKSDYIRYAVLYDFGGLYVDTDFECLKPHDDLMWLSFFSSVADNKTPCLYIGHIGCEKGNAIIKECLDGMKYFNDSSNKHILDTTGVYYFTHKFFSNVQRNPSKTVIFPPEYFYPFPGNQRNATSREYRLSFCTENTYAIHHWGTSWT